MARPWFKSWSKRVLPEPLEHSTFVLLAGVTLLLLSWQWRPRPGTLWHVDSVAWTYAIYGLLALGWVLVLLSTFLIDHFELFGLQQVYLHWRRREPRQPTVRVPWLYRMVRHPLMLGFLVEEDAVWKAADERSPVARLDFGKLRRSRRDPTQQPIDLHIESRPKAAACSLYWTIASTNSARASS